LKRTLFAILGILAMLVIFANACSTTSTPKKSTKTFWYKNGNEIQTNDLKRFSEYVPFTIILPGFLPDELKSESPKLTRDDYPLSSGAVEVEIDYYNNSPEDIKYVNIHEDNSSLVWGIDPQTDISYTERGTNITYNKSRAVFTSKKGESVYNKLVFYFNIGNININVEICGYDLDISKQIVKSMISTR
jgi:hypothetical protein